MFGISHVIAEKKEMWEFYVHVDIICTDYPSLPSPLSVNQFFLVISICVLSANRQVWASHDSEHRWLWIIEIWKSSGGRNVWETPGPTSWRWRRPSSDRPQRPRWGSLPGRAPRPCPTAPGRWAARRWRPSRTSPTPCSTHACLYVSQQQQTHHQVTQRWHQPAGQRSKSRNNDDPSDCADRQVPDRRQAHWRVVIKVLLPPSSARLWLRQHSNHVHSLHRYLSDNLNIFW